MVYFVCVPVKDLEDAQLLADDFVVKAKMPLSMITYIDSKTVADPKFGQGKITMDFIGGSVSQKISKEIVKIQEDKGVPFGGKYC